MTGHSSGIKEDFESFFSDHIAAVRHYAMTLVPSAEVDDLVQMTFTTAWQKFDSIPADAQRPWLYGVARNQGRNRRRSGARSKSLVEAIKHARPALTTHISASGFDPAEVSPLLEVIAELDDKDRELMILAGWFEMTPTEIAQVIGAKPGAVRVRLHRVRKTVNDRYQEKINEGEVA